jgi:predicted secreted hydrolase
MNLENARWSRRRWLSAGLGVACCVRGLSARAGRPQIHFPRDHGSHPWTLTEWWYITGWLREDAHRPLGMQVTFFRNRPRVQEDNPSAFAPEQLLFAHAALSDPDTGRLQHEQRSARAGLGLALAAEETTYVRIDDWSLLLEDGRYRARIAGRSLDFKLDFEPTQPALLEGQAGFSRKGPLPGEASCYYSFPHLAVSGSISVAGRSHAVSGRAWLDHEWSSNYLGKPAAGWDWTGVNLDDGSALMAFRIRDKRGGVYWASATHRTADGTVRTLSPLQVQIHPLRRWRSPRTDVDYPVAMRVHVGDLVLELQPLMDDQELDSRASTGAIYWEGAVQATQSGRVVGRGYLELTGYAAPLRM